MLVYARQNGTAYVAESEPLLRERLGEGSGDGQPTLFTSIETLDSLEELVGVEVVEVGDIDFDRRICPECNDKFTLHHGPQCLRCGI